MTEERIDDQFEESLRDRDNLKSTTSPPQPAMALDEKMIAEALDDTFATMDAIGGQLKDRNLAKASTLKKAALKAKEIFADFVPYSASAHTLPFSTYVRPGENVDAAQKRIVRQDLKRMAQADKKRPKMGMTLKLRPSDLRRLGISTDHDGPLKAKISFNDFFEYVADKFPESNLHLSEYWLDRCMAEQQAHWKLDEVFTGAAEPPAAPIEVGAEHTEPNEDSDGSSNDELVQTLVSHLTEHLTAPESSLKYGVPEKGRPGPEEVNAEALGLSLRGGPADVTAYHDFYDLQLSFRPLSTSEFDTEIKGIAETIWTEMATTVTEAYGGSYLDENAEVGGEEDRITTVDQLKSFIQDLKNIQMAIGGADERYGLVVDTVLPNLTLDEWTKLDYRIQRILANLVLISTLFCPVFPDYFGLSV